MFSKKKPLVSLPKKMVEICVPNIKNATSGHFFYDPNEDIHFFPKEHITFLESVMAVSKTIHAGVNIGRIIKTDVIPHHALALALDKGENLQQLELNKELSLAFLQKSLHEIPESPKGWLLVTYAGLGLGWIKNLGNRINNYLPNEAKIRMDIS
jgi:NOL1/NOP2/fmu family ribosome biogenesis protein